MGVFRTLCRESDAVESEPNSVWCPLLATWAQRLVAPVQGTASFKTVLHKRRRSVVLEAELRSRLRALDVDCAGMQTIPGTEIRPQHRHRHQELAALARPLFRPLKSVKHAQLRRRPSVSFDSHSASSLCHYFPSKWHGTRHSWLVRA